MNTRRNRRSVLVAVLIALLYLGFFGGALEAQGRRRQSRRAEEGEALEKLTDSLVKKIEKRPNSISSVISAYNDVERKRRFDLAGRYRLHEALLEALKDVENRALSRSAARLLRSPSKSKFAGQVLMMKAAIGEKFPAPREKRIEWLTRMVRGKHAPLTIWGLRLLGDSGWPEAVDALIEIMDEEEEKKHAGSVVWQLVRGELYRVLGGRTAHATALAIRVDWERRGKKIPDAPDYSLAQSDGRPRATAAFFGDQISPRSVFAIDTSGSMRQGVTIRSSRGRSSSKTAVAKEGTKRSNGWGTTKRKIDIVKSELERAISGLQPLCEFNVFRYSETYTPWKGLKGALELVAANTKNVASARTFARSLESESGTNIYATLEAALEIPELDTVYLLSDGVPSVGGGVEDIERNVARRNYLKGARIVTYGFTAEKRGLFDESGGFDEAFMKRLAARNWGWYRRLNSPRSREKDADPSKADS